MTDVRTPTSIAIIVDGNRRWAKAKGLPSIEGHRAGFENLKKLFSVAKQSGIIHVYAYLFSTENWNRSSDEVSYLMDLFRSLIRDLSAEFKKEQIGLRFLGAREMLPEDIQNCMKEIERDQPSSPVMTVGACLSYGGRLEIMRAAEALFADGSHAISEEAFKARMWSHDMPDPDLIIRTGGEKRLSNFLTWQSVYSELFFTDTMFPDFSEKEFHAIVKEYGERERRRGR